VAKATRLGAVVQIRIWEFKLWLSIQKRLGFFLFFYKTRNLFQEREPRTNNKSQGQSPREKIHWNAQNSRNQTQLSKCPVGRLLKPPDDGVALSWAREESPKPKLGGLGRKLGTKARCFVPHRLDMVQRGFLNEVLQFSFIDDPHVPTQPAKPKEIRV